MRVLCRATLYVVWYLGLSQLALATVLAQDLTPQEQYDIYPQNMWADDAPTWRRYSTDDMIREELAVSLKDRTRHQEIVIESKSLGRYYDFFAQNEIERLKVDNATNDDIRKLSKLDSLRELALPACKADDFRPLAEMDKLLGLSLANPNMKQFKEEQLLARMDSLRSLTLYNVPDLQEAVELPGLDPASSFEEKGLFLLIIQAPQWNPWDRVEWPEKLEKMKDFCVLGDRIRFAYLRGEWAEIWIGRYENDAPSICSLRLKDLMEKSGFYDRKKVTVVSLRSKHVRHDGGRRKETYDATDVSPLKALSDLRSLELTGNFYGYEHLSSVPLRRVYFYENSPFPSEEAVKILSEHPTLDNVTKNIYSATDEVLWKREK